MKTWTDLKLIAEPSGIARLPKDARGYPTPFTVQRMPDGVPDFRVIDPEKWAYAVTTQRCALCGGKATLFAFVGGPRSIERHTFTDAGMHKECAEYALKVCPFLAAPKFAYNRAEIAGTTVNEHVSTVRPDIFGLATASDYGVMNYKGEYVIYVGNYLSVAWWKDGVQLEGGPG